MLGFVALSGDQALAQVNADPTPPGTLHPVPLPPLADPNSPTEPAKELFARKTEPLAGPARSIGGYADGCLAGGVALPITGPNWQVMRLSRNRNWGNPELITFLERFAKHAKAEWNGLLVGDMSQPRGGPMISGHASHQIGLDADIWFTPMPDHVLSPEEREMNGATNIVAPDGLGVDNKIWTHNYLELIRTASLDPATTRIFVNPAIKKANVRRGRIGPRLAHQGAAVVGPCRAFSRPARLPRRQRRMQGAEAAGSG